MAEPAEHLIYFYGTECVHCVEMDEPKKRLEEEHGLKLKELECWHNDENAKLLEKYDQGRCGGIPFMYNTKTDKFICGNCDYDTLKQWALE